MITVTSPVAQFPGTIVLPDFLTFPQAIAYEDAIDDARARFASGQITRRDVRAYQQAMLPAVCKIVVEWHLTYKNGTEMGVPTPDTFPCTPADAGHALISWIITEIGKVYDGDVPLA